MQFLVDAQLPPALARWISAQGYSACHVANIGMASARDPEIWNRAYGDDSIIITKDEDFFYTPHYKSRRPHYYMVTHSQLPQADNA